MSINLLDIANFLCSYIMQSLDNINNDEKKEQNKSK